MKKFITLLLLLASLPCLAGEIICDEDRTMFEDLQPIDPTSAGDIVGKITAEYRAFDVQGYYDLVDLKLWDQVMGNVKYSALPRQDQDQPLLKGYVVFDLGMILEQKVRFYLPSSRVDLENHAGFKAYIEAVPEGVDMAQLLPFR